MNIRYYQFNGRTPSARPGTWRNWMLTIVARDTNSHDADANMSRTKPPLGEDRFASFKNGIDWNWLEKNGYILPRSSRSFSPLDPV